MHRGARRALLERFPYGLYYRTAGQRVILAAAFLRLRGFRILARNVREGPREIDLIAEDAGWVVVVEVRYRADSSRGRPEESVGWRKRTHLLRAGFRDLSKLRGKSARIKERRVPGAVGKGKGCVKAKAAAVAPAPAPASAPVVAASAPIAPVAE